MPEQRTDLRGKGDSGPTVSGVLKAAEARGELRGRGNVEGVLDALREAVKAYPDQRVCQIIVNATNRNDPFYVEDSELDRMLRDYAVRAGRDR